MNTNVFDLYDAALHFVDFVVSRTSDSLAEIMIKALPLLAPLPNAVSIYFIVQHQLHYNTVQAFAVAAGLECMFFALTEVVLLMWDGVQGDDRYRWPLGVAGGVFVLYFLLVLALVATLEVAQGNYAPLAFPFISLVAAVTLGCFRWHKRYTAQPTRKAKPAQVKPVIVRPESEQMHNETVQGAQVDCATDDDDGTIDKRQRAAQLRSEGLSHAQIASELDVHRNTIANWLKHTNGHKEPTS